MKSHPIFLSTGTSNGVDFGGWIGYCMGVQKYRMIEQRWPYGAVFHGSSGAVLPLSAALFRKR